MKIVDRSIKLAYSIPNANGTHFSFIFRRNKLLSVGTNNVNHPSPKIIKLGRMLGLPELIKYPYSHSEMDAISKLLGKERLDSSIVMVNIRLTSKGLRNSRPCKKCQDVIRPFGINRIVYSVDNDFRWM